MRTLWILAGGFALLALAYGAAKTRPGGGPLGASGTIALFLVVWLALAAGNLYLGVTQAGYSVREELPIFLLIFLVPAAAALLLRWKSL
jgi:hypothetical protein